MTEFFQNLKLTVVQWLGVTAAATIGLLVLALRIQGSRLHAAQVTLLKTKAAEGTADALANYNREKDAYLKAGGKI